MATVKIKGTKIKYYMHDRLKKQFKEKIIPSLLTKDKDCIIALDGAEGAGKSTMALQLGRLVDPTLNLSRVVFDAESFKQAIFKAKKGQCVIYDEAFTGLSSRTSLSGINTALVSLMMQMRQKNLFVILVLPTFFLLDKYAALFRTKLLIHVYEVKGIRGYFRLYNRKKKKYVYLYGKKDYSYNAKRGTKHYVSTRFKGRFYGVFALGKGGTKEQIKIEEDKYKKKKEKALEETQRTPMSAGQLKYKNQRDVIIYLFRKHTKKTYQEIEELFIDQEVDISFQQVRNVCAKFGDTERLELRKELLQIKREKKEEKEKEEEKDLEYKENIKILEEESNEEIEEIDNDEELSESFSNA